MKATQRTPTNHERLLQLAEDAFAMRSDPAQLQVDEHVLEHLRQLHPATVCEANDAHGPIAWVLLIPTTLELMQDFVQGRITEQQLYDRTPMGVPYQAVYLCSGLVLPEHQRQGLATRMTLEALDHFLNTVLELNGDLAGGLYMVHITAGDKTYTERLVIQP